MRRKIIPVVVMAVFIVSCATVSGVFKKIPSVTAESWVEIGAGSAVGAGISQGKKNSFNPSLALDSSGNPVVAWQDDGEDNDQIYIKRWDGKGWAEVGAGSASGVGISKGKRDSMKPSLALDPSGNPVVAYIDNGFENLKIFVKRWDGKAWAEVGKGAASGYGVSDNFGDVNSPSLAVDAKGVPVVAWSDETWGPPDICVKRFEGAKWVEVGAHSGTEGCISGNKGYSQFPSLTLDSAGNPIVAWQDDSSGNYEIFIKKWNGSSWVEIGQGSASGGGISNNGGRSLFPSVSLDASGSPVVAWQDGTSGTMQIYVKRWNGTAWVEVGAASATGDGISASKRHSNQPALALDSAGKPVVAWTNLSFGAGDICVKKFDGNAWVEVGVGSATSGGISENIGISASPDLALDASGKPVVTWHDLTSGNLKIYIKRYAP